jgi:hypothetical protein
MVAEAGHEVGEEITRAILRQLTIGVEQATGGADVSFGLLQYGHVEEHQ